MSASSSTGGPPPPVAPPPPEQRGGRRLTRRLRGRMLGGVAGGLAAFLGIDVVVARIGFVVLAFLPFPGFGVLLYGAMLLLVPAGDDGDETPESSTERGAGFYIGVLLVTVATFWLLVAGIDLWRGPGNVLVPLLLIGLGVALWVDADRRGQRSTPVAGAPGGAPPAATWTPPPVPGSATGWAPTVASATTTPAPRATETATDRPDGGPESAAWDRPGPPAGLGGGHDGDGGDGGGGDGGGSRLDRPSPGPAWQPPPLPRERRSSPLGRITVGTALLAGGAVWLLDVAGVVSVPTSAVIAVVLGVVGLGLLVGSVAGRARWLALLVAVLLPAALVTASIGDLGIDVRDGVASRTVVVTETSELEDSYQLGVGELILDLSQIDDPAALDDVRIEAGVGAGQLQVRLPESIGVRGQARVAAGELLILGVSQVGFDLGQPLSVGAPQGGPIVELDLRAGVGSVEVWTWDSFDGTWFEDEGFDTGAGFFDDIDEAFDDTGRGDELDEDPGVDQDPDLEPEPEPPADEPAALRPTVHATLEVAR